MDGTLVSEHRRSDARKKSGSPRWSAHDFALIKAKQQNSIVKLNLAIETEYTDAEGSCKGLVCEVDRFSVRFEIDRREIWISKAFIVSTEILNG